MYQFSKNKNIFKIYLNILKRMEKELIILVKYEINNYYLYLVNVVLCSLSYFYFTPLRNLKKIKYYSIIWCIII